MSNRGFDDQGNNLYYQHSTIKKPLGLKVKLKKSEKNNCNSTCRTMLFISSIVILYGLFYFGTNIYLTFNMLNKC